MSTIIYTELELNLRIKPRKRLHRDKLDTVAVTTAPNFSSSMDFMVDRLGDGRVYPAMLVSAGKLELSYGFLAIFFDRADCGSLLLGRFQGADMRPKEPRDSGQRDPLRARLDQIIDT